MDRDVATSLVGVVWMLVAVPALGFAVLLVPANVQIALEDPRVGHEPWAWIVGAAIGLAEVVWIGGTAALVGATGWGLLRGRAWAWGMAVALGAGSILVCCPVGPLTLPVLLRSGSRRSCRVA